MTTYIDPRQVDSPKRYVSNVRVVYDGGADDCAVAELDWDGQPGIGIRWNGNSETQPLGNPQSRGYAQWYLVPQPFQDVVLERARELAPDRDLDAAYREMGADTKREQDARAWSEALIGDASHAPR